MFLNCHKEVFVSDRSSRNANSFDEILVILNELILEFVQFKLVYSSQISSFWLRSSPSHQRVFTLQGVFKGSLRGLQGVFKGYSKGLQRVFKGSSSSF